MTRIVIGAELTAQLQNMREPLELCDASGRVIGRFLPLPPPSGRGPTEPQISEEELDRREQETESFTTSEVVAYLERL